MTTGRLEERDGYVMVAHEKDGKEIKLLALLHCDCGAVVGNPYILYGPPPEPDYFRVMSNPPLMARCPVCDCWVTLK